MHTVVTWEPERIAVVFPRLAAVVTDFYVTFINQAFSTIVDDVGACRMKADGSCGRVSVNEFRQALPCSLPLTSVEAKIEWAKELCRGDKRESEENN